jgi:hypothetical protein
MSKFSSSGNFNSQTTPIEIPKPAPVPPSANTQKNFGQDLAGQGLIMDQSALDYTRANAMGDLPENRQSTGSANNYSVPEFTDEFAQQAQPEEAVQEPFPNQGQPQLEAMGPDGLPLNIEQARAHYEETMRLQKLNALRGSEGFRNEEELQQAFSMARPDTQESATIMKTARRIGDTLNSMTVSQIDGGIGMNAHSNGLVALMEGYHLKSAPAAAALATKVLAITAPIFMGAEEVKDGDIASGHKEAADSLDFLNSNEFGSLFEDEGIVEPQAKVGKIDRDTAIGVFGKGLQNLTRRTAVDPLTGQALKPLSTMNSNYGGALLLNAAVESGTMLRDIVDGKEMYQFSPINGREFITSSRGLAADLTEGGRGRSQATPVTNFGNPVGAQINTRRGAPNRVNKTEVPVMTETMRILGSVGYVPSPERAFYGILFGINAIHDAAGALPLPSIEGGGNSFTANKDARTRLPLPIQGIPNVSKLMGLSADGATETSAFRAQATGLMKTLNYNSQNILHGGLRYAPHWADYVVQRAYNDAEDLNMQGNLPLRATLGGVNVAMNVSNTPKWHTNPISKMEAGEIWKGMQTQFNQKNFDLTDKQKEFSFLAVLGKNLDVGSERGVRTESLQIHDMVSLVSPEFIGKAAEIGAVLKSVIPTDKNGIVTAGLNPKTLEGFQLTPKQQQVITNFVNGSTKKNWGFRLQAYLDAADYLNAKEKGLSFTPKATTDIDMNSAGRAFLAADIGNEVVLRRTGMLWDPFVAHEGGFESTQPDGNPRFYFMKVAADKTIHTAVPANIPGLKEAWQDFFNKTIDAKDFSKADEFGKGVLLTTDYGKAAQYNFDQAVKFLQKNPELTQKLLPLYDNSRAKLVEGLNDIFHATLKSVVDMNQMALPKHLVSILQTLNRLPQAKGYWGETLGIGSFMNQPTGDFMQISNADGTTTRIPKTVSQVDSMGRAKEKMIQGYQDVDPKTGKRPDDVHYVPEPGSAARNQIGPILGQYRESVLVAETLNYINGGKAPKDMKFVASVFDNLILNTDSYLAFMHVANNIVLPKVLEWNVQDALISDFTKQYDDGLRNLSVEKEVDIGAKGMFKGLLMNWRLMYGYSKGNVERYKAGDGPKPSEKDLMIVKTMESLPFDINSKEDSLTISGKMAAKLVHSYQQISLNSVYKDDKGEYKSKSKLSEWQKLGQKEKNYYLEKIKEMARRGLVYFMN